MIRNNNFTSRFKRKVLPVQIRQFHRELYHYPLIKYQ